MKDKCRKDQLFNKQRQWHPKEIKVKGQKLGKVTSFKYLGAIVSDEGSKPEVLSRIAHAMQL